ncbi:nuclear protein [Lobaria immixta]|nr:nuclear protein [Lobaria immixta]
MVRRTNRSLSDEEEDEDVQMSSAMLRPRRTRGANLGSLSPSPAESFSSDKENRQSAKESSHQANGKSKAMAPPKMPRSASMEPLSPRANKRRRLSERGAPNASQMAHERELRELGNIQFYDPDQDMDERRAVRKGIRDLSKELTDSRAEYLAAGSDGLVKTLEKANEIFESVKQTSDATLDSRLLVSAADLSAKRTTQLNVGDASHGIDVDDFVGKCITFMRRGPSTGDTISSSRRRGRQDDSDEDGSAAENSADEGDAFNWEWLGRQACFPNSVRPPVPGFLLGPLSVQKRVRKQTQRRERLQKRDPRDAVRPEELKSQDLEQVENSNLTTQCKNIRALLVQKMKEGAEQASLDVRDGMSVSEIKAVMDRNNIASDKGVPLFHFVINPRSFGQTVENLFYVSFLIKEGSVGIGNDSDGVPTLHGTKARPPAQIKAQSIQKHQAVFHLDYETWEDLIDAYNIEESIIPNRQSDQVTQISATGWYA